MKPPTSTSGSPRRKRVPADLHHLLDLQDRLSPEELIACALSEGRTLACLASLPRRARREIQLHPPASLPSPCAPATGSPPRCQPPCAVRLPAGYVFDQRRRSSGSGCLYRDQGYRPRQRMERFHRRTVRDQEVPRQARYARPRRSAPSAATNVGLRHPAPSAACAAPELHRAPW